mmetsp:Transcript_24292/g.76451  ORF Transcript_24292/g.76451 Transcript_24292/m.76451 type:complete len:215 (+) Transcript_24292:324-968(+)
MEGQGVPQESRGRHAQVRQLRGQPQEGKKGGDFDLYGSQREQQTGRAGGGTKERAHRPEEGGDAGQRGDSAAASRGGRLSARAQLPGRGGGWVARGGGQGRGRASEEDPRPSVGRRSTRGGGTGRPGGKGDGLGAALEAPEGGGGGGGGGDCPREAGGPSGDAVGQRLQRPRRRRRGGRGGPCQGGEGAVRAGEPPGPGIGGESEEDLAEWSLH